MIMRDKVGDVVSDIEATVAAEVGAGVRTDVKAGVVFGSSLVGTDAGTSNSHGSLTVVHLPLET
jgi:hypothetical protein